MSEHEETYDRGRPEQLMKLLRDLANRIQELDRLDALLASVPELQRRLGDVRSELFHYEVRSTYDTPEAAEHRRIVDQAKRADPFTNDNPEDDEPWRHQRPE